jgi:hypothetical protein
MLRARDPTRTEERIDTVKENLRKKQRRVQVLQEE